MPRPCSICIHAAKVAINDALRDGGSKRAVAARFDVSSAAVHRHKVNCLGIVDAEKAAEKPSPATSSTGTAEAVRFVSGRCPACDMQTDAIEPPALLARAERLLYLAEGIAAKAREIDDSRLALQAVDRARAALETMMRAVGMIGGDVIVVGENARRTLTLETAVEKLLDVIPADQQASALRWLQAWVSGERVPPYSRAVTLESRAPALAQS